jgi:outer membrane lipoprotein-sorting protein
MVREISDKMLDKVIEGRRGMGVPAGPSAALAAATVKRLEEAEMPLQKSRWRLPVVRVSLAAAGLILVAGVLFAVLGRARVAFADVIDNVKAATCVHFKMVGKVAQANGPAVDLKAEVWITQDGRLRQEMQPSGSIAIQDPKEGKSLMLVPAIHQATVVETAHAPAQRNFLEQLKSVDAKTAVSVGTKEIAGHKTEGFKVTQPTMEMTVWADVETRLPVQVEQTLKMSIVPETTVTLTDFQWNAEIDPQLLSLTPPKGYTVQTMTVDMTAQEKDLVTALEEAAKLNGGKYPDTFDVAGIAGAMGKNLGEAVAKNHWTTDSPEFKALQQKNTDAMAVIARGWVFVNDPKNGTNWWYAGKDVEAEKAETAIMWYRPNGSEKYHVIEADLKVREAAEAELPKGGVKMGTTGKATTVDGK